METTYIKTSKLEKIFKELHENFGGTLETNSNEYTLNLNDQFGSGTINGISLKNGISYLEFEVNLNNDVTLSINATENLPIYFAYCSGGYLGHSFGENREQRTLQKYQTGILASKKAEENNLTFKKGIHTKISLIVVNTKVSETSVGFNFNKKLRDTFFENDKIDHSVYISSFNLKIGNKIGELKAIKQTGVIRSLMIEGIVNLVLAMEIQQHVDDLKNVENGTGCLTQYEMESVKEISDQIINFPEDDYTLKLLSKKSGISASKLQEGFKILHNRTVRDFIINERIKKSEQLIRTTDLNISEVVYSIGFTSRSYFSKIFKQKYDCSPKYYKENQNPLAATA